MYGTQERYIQDLVGRPDGQRYLRRPRRRWENNIITDLQEVGWGRDRNDLFRNRDRWPAVVMQ